MAHHRQGCTHPQLSDSSLVGQLTQQARHCQQSSAPDSHLQPANSSLYYYYLLLLLTTTSTTYYYYYCLLLQAAAPDAEPLCARDQDARTPCRLTLCSPARSCTMWLAAHAQRHVHQTQESVRSDNLQETARNSSQKQGSETGRTRASAVAASKARMSCSAGSSTSAPPAPRALIMSRASSSCRPALRTAALSSMQRRRAM